MLLLLHFLQRFPGRCIIVPPAPSLSLSLSHSWWARIRELPSLAGSRRFVNEKVARIFNLECGSGRSINICMMRLGVLIYIYIYINVCVYLYNVYGTAKFIRVYFRCARDGLRRAVYENLYFDVSYRTWIKIFFFIFRIINNTVRAA